MVGATTIESEDTSGPSVRSLGELATQLYHLHPGFCEAEILEINAGLRPAFPHHKPKVICTKKNLRINGLYRHGFLTAPAIAESVIDYLEGGKIDEELFASA
jgi:glycine oxidase